MSRVGARHRTSWGDWTYKPNATLDYRGGRYEIDLEDCTTSAAVLDWLCQVACKNWGPPALGHLVEAFNDTLRPQSSLCSCCLTGGRGKRIDDVKAHLAARGYDVSGA